MFREAAVKSIMGERETTHQWSVGLTRKCLGPGQVQGLARVKLDRCFESRLGRTIGAMLTGFNLEGEKPRMALKQPNDSVVLAAPPPQSWLWITAKCAHSLAGGRCFIQSGHDARVVVVSPCL